MSSGENRARGAGRPGSGPQHEGGEEQSADDGPARRRARWRDLSPAALRTGSVPSAEDLGEDAYWSFLRGDPEHSSSDADTDPRDDRAEQRQPPPSAAEAWTTASMPTWSPRTTADGNAAPPDRAVADGWEAAGPWIDRAAPIRLPEPDPEPASGPVGLEPASGPEELEPASGPVGLEPASGPEELVPAPVPAPAPAPAREPQPGPADFPRRARVLPGIGWPLAWTAVVTLGWLAVAAFGVVRLDLLWSLLAVAAGVGALALGLQGRSAVGLVPVLVGAAAWGMATGGEVPASPSDIVGDLQLIGLNSLYAVPLLIAYGLTTWLDAVGSARDRVRAAVADRRWWPDADVPDAAEPDAEPGVVALEAIPSARFFRLQTGPYPHLVTAGRRVALIRSTVWPPGLYTVTETGEVRRDGRDFAAGSDELRAVIAEARRWTERMGPAASAVTGFLVVHPAADRPGDAVRLDPPRPGGVQGVQLVSAAGFVALAGDYLAAEPYRLDVGLTERLGAYLPIFAPPEPSPASPEPSAGLEPPAA